MLSGISNCTQMRYIIYNNRIISCDVSGAKFQEMTNRIPSNDSSLLPGLLSTRRVRILVLINTSIKLNANKVGDKSPLCLSSPMSVLLSPLCMSYSWNPPTLKLPTCANCNTTKTTWVTYKKGRLIFELKTVYLEATSWPDVGRNSL